MGKTLVQIFVLFVFSLQGCNSLYLEKIPIPGEKDVSMYADWSNCLNSFSSCQPPLDSLWNYDIGAGIGPYPPSFVGDMLFTGNLRGEILIIDVRKGDLLAKKKLGSSIMGTPIIDGEIIYVALTNSVKSVVAYNFRHNKELWNVKIGDIESSPLLLNSKIYVTELTGNLYCIDAKSGKIEWKYSVSNYKKSLFQSSPATDGNTLFACSDDGNVFCISQNKQIIWGNKIKSSIFTSPIVCGEDLYLNSADSCIYCLSKYDGNIRWKKKVSAKMYGPPVLNENFLLAGCVDGSVWCLDRKNGNVTWVKFLGGVFKSSPTIAGSIVYAANLNNKLYALTLDDGKIIYEYKLHGSLNSDPVLYKNLLFLFIQGRSLTAFQGSK